MFEILMLAFIGGLHNVAFSFEYSLGEHNYSFNDSFWNKTVKWYSKHDFEQVLFEEAQSIPLFVVMFSWIKPFKLD